MKNNREALQRSAARLELLHGIDLAVLAGRPVEELVGNTLRELGRVIPNWRSSIMVLEAGGEAGTLLAVESGAESGMPSGSAVTLASDEMERLARGEVVYQEDALANPSSSPSENQSVASGMRSHIHVPMIAGGTLLGTLNLASDRPRAFIQEHVQIAEEVARRVAIAIEQHGLRQQVAGHLAELEERVAARTSELAERESALRAANDRLTELDQLKSEFVSNVSHELRTPLNNIKLYLELLRSGAQAKRDHYLDTLDRESDLLQVLIEDLLELSRLDLGRTVLDMQHVDAGKLAAALVEDRRALVEHQGLALRLEVHPGQLPVRADPRMLSQVLSNLVTNAVNYTPSGGSMTVSAGEETREAGGRWVFLSVADTGHGVAPQEMERIFERFYRGSAAQSTGTPGTGLGLAICREIVQRHGGRIDLRSTFGNGSTFTVWLPAA